MNKILYFHRKFKSITCVCGDVEIYHACDVIIRETKTIDLCANDC